MTKNSPQDIFKRIEIVTESGCWIYMDCGQRGGYGRFMLDGKRLKAHKVMWELTNGPVPEGMCLDHLCRVPSCINPAHLEVVTFKENILRGTGPTAINAAKTICKRGHELTPENTYIQNIGTHVQRSCRQCRALNWDEWYAKNRQRRYWIKQPKLLSLHWAAPRE